MRKEIILSLLFLLAVGGVGAESWTLYEDIIITNNTHQNTFGTCSDGVSMNKTYCDDALGTWTYGGVWYLNDSDGDNLIRIYTNNNIELNLSGVTIIGNNSANSKAVGIAALNNITIYGLTVSNFLYGIRSDFANDTYIYNCSFNNMSAITGSEYGIYHNRGYNHTIRNNYFNNSLYASVGCIMTSNCTISDNYFDYVPTSVYNIVLSSTSGITDKSNILRNRFSSGTGIYFINNNTNVTIIGNNFSGISTALKNNIGNLDKVVISNNTFYNCSAIADLGNFSRLNFSDNILLSSGSFQSHDNFTELFFSRNYKFGYRVPYNSSWSFEFAYGLGYNVTIEDSVFINDSSTSIGFMYGNYSDILLKNNSFYYNYHDKYGNAGDLLKFRNINGEEININENIFNRTSKLNYILNSNASITFRNNVYDDMSDNGDAYNVGIMILRGDNIKIINNTFNRIGCTGILMHTGSNIEIINNTFDYDLTHNLQRVNNCHHELPTAIWLSQIWKTYTSDALEQPDDDLAHILTYPIGGINISGNVFNDVPVMAVISNSTYLNHDLINYRYHKLSFINTLQPITEYFLNDYYDNMFTTYSLYTADTSVIQRYVLGFGYKGTNSGIKIQYVWNNTVSVYKNINDTHSYIMEQYNLSSYSVNGIFRSNTTITSNSLSMPLYPQESVTIT